MTSEELPIFPAPAPEIMSDRAATAELFTGVLEQLASVVDLGGASLAGATPCEGFTVQQLQTHTLAWLQFFAAALNDPEGTSERPDPESWTLPTHQQGADIVASALLSIKQAIEEVPDGALVVMAEARMTKEAVLAMALGEYLTHGWDLSMSTGQAWQPTAEAVAPAFEFLRGTVIPEYRGPDTGFFDAEVPVPDGATLFEEFLCFCGRNPAWSAS